MKNKVLKPLLVLLFIANVGVIIAQNKQGKDFYDVGEYESAKSYFLKNGTLTTADYYCLGDIYFKENKYDSALYYFEKGMQVEPDNVYSRIGFAKLRTAKTGSTDLLKKITDERKYRKNAEVHALIAAAYFDNGLINESLTQLTNALKVNSNNPMLNSMRGDYLSSQGETGEAATFYESAIYFDNSYKPAYVKLALMYQNIRTQIALDFLKQVIEIDSSYIPGYYFYSLINYKKGFYPEALKSYKIYMDLIDPESKDYEMYASILYFNKMYNETIEAIKKAPDNLVMNRLNMYSLMELGDYAKALESAEKLFNRYSKNDLITQDYYTYGMILKNSKHYVESANAFISAYESDKSKLEYLQEAANAFDIVGDHDNAIKYYTMILENNPEPSLANYYTLGAAYYSAGTSNESYSDNSHDDQLKKKEYLIGADKIFSSMIEHFPEHYLGYLMRARANFALDPEANEGLAVPFYTKALEIMLNDVDSRKNDILESYRYLGFYHLGQNNVSEAKNFWGKVLELEPTDETALEVMKSLK